MLFACWKVEIFYLANKIKPVWARQVICFSSLLTRGNTYCLTCLECFLNIGWYKRLGPWSSCGLLTVELALGCGRLRQPLVLPLTASTASQPKTRDSFFFVSWLPLKASHSARRVRSDRLPNAQRKFYTRAQSVWKQNNSSSIIGGLVPHLHLHLTISGEWKIPGILKTQTNKYPEWSRTPRQPPDLHFRYLKLSVRQPETNVILMVPFAFNSYTHQL